jgi:ferritin
MLDRNLEADLNAQMDREFFSSYLYLAMAAHFETQNLGGMATWMRRQADEEREHAMKFFDFILDRGATVRLGAIEAPPDGFGTPLEVFEQALGHEREITAAINGLFEHADKATEVFLHWFATEQVEEERSVEQVVEALKRAGDSGAALLMLDRELGARGAAG